MQCVILAAGEGTRMRPLTLERPKPLIEVAGKPLIAHVVEALPHEIDSLVIMIGYRGDMIREYCGDVFQGRPVTYITQENPKAGNADALFTARDALYDRFLVLYGDDIHGRAALKKMVNGPDAALAIRTDHPERFGVIEQNEDGTLKHIIEKPERPSSNLVNPGGFVISTDIFDCIAEKSPLGEYFLVDNINLYVKTHPMNIIEQDLWITVNYPEDIEKAEAILSGR